MLTIGALLKYWRENKNWQLRTVAQKAGVSFGNLSHLEVGDKLPRQGTLESLSVVYGQHPYITITILLGMPENLRPKWVASVQMPEGAKPFIARGKACYPLAAAVDNFLPHAPWIQNNIRTLLLEYATEKEELLANPWSLYFFFTQIYDELSIFFALRDRREWWARISHQISFTATKINSPMEIHDAAQEIVAHMQIMASMAKLEPAIRGGRELKIRKINDLLKMLTEADLDQALNYVAEKIGDELLGRVKLEGESTDPSAKS